jgi:molybdenum cofactor cytidylyltransferase
LLEGGADPVLVIVPSLAEPGALDLQREAAQSGAVVVPCPSQTPDMRATVERGLIALDKLAPDYPGLLLLPGDCPGVTAQVVATVRRRFLAHPDHAVVPVHGERRGHPLALPRRLCRRIPQLPMEVGINSLLRDPHEIVIPVEVDDPKILADLDTPDDYRRWSRP